MHHCAIDYNLGPSATVADFRTISRSLWLMSRGKPASVAPYATPAKHLCFRRGLIHCANAQAFTSTSRIHTAGSNNTYCSDTH